MSSASHGTHSRAQPRRRLRHRASLPVASPASIRLPRPPLTQRRTRGLVVARVRSLRPMPGFRRGLTLFPREGTLKKLSEELC
ncbi:uncharacterized protein M6B38_293255 [Iris pallida]|uniref:Uncharacterized protein n=1 Tax=Iris pallida TaxID=29817 RepID=A0AAX6HV30_IRIPA|nr:uncharacterized protein M6B38_293255 [Iris pallida]